MMKKTALCSLALLSAFVYANPGSAHYDVLAVDHAPEFNAPYNPQYWAHIPGIENGAFHYPWRDIPAPPTSFKAVHDNENLYMVFTAEDPNIILKDWTNEKTVGKEDRVEVFFAPSAIDEVADNHLPYYYGLEIDPQGRVHDYQARYYRNLDSDWDLNQLETNGEIKDNTYIVRIKVPLEELKKLNLIKKDGSIQTGLFRAEFVPDPNQDNKDNVDRRWMSWVNPHTAKPDFHVDSAFGELRLLPPKK